MTEPRTARLHLFMKNNPPHPFREAYRGPGRKGTGSIKSGWKHQIRPELARLGPSAKSAIRSLSGEKRTLANHRRWPPPRMVGALAWAVMPIQTPGPMVKL